jgi:hypothetical protein
MDKLLKYPLRIRTLAFLVACALLAIAAAWAGIDDNPPGVLLAYLAAAAFVLAWVHSWRSPRNFMALACLSLLGMALLIVLDNIVTAVGHNPATPGTLQIALQSTAYVLFLYGTLVCPAAFLVGVAGWIMVFVRSRHQPA